MTAEAAALIAAGDDAGALCLLRSAVLLGDRAAPLLLNLALAEARAGDAARGAALIETLERDCPDWDELHLRRAERARAAGRHAEAAGAYDRTLAVNPSRFEALLGRAVLLLRQGEAAGAMRLLERACVVAPDRPEAWDTYGVALLANGAPGDAVEALAEARRLAPGDAAIARRYVDACARSQMLETAVPALQQAAAGDPLQPGHLIALAAALEALGRYDEAADAAEAAFSLDPSSAAAASLRGGALLAANRLAEAEAALARAIALDPGAAMLVNNRAAALIRLHRPAEARGLLGELLREHGSEPSVLCNLATATLACGEQEEAERLAREAIRLAPDDVLPRRTLCNTVAYGERADAASVLAAARACSARLPRGPAPRFSNKPDPERRLRVGLLSGAMRTHPVGWLTIAGFEALDPAFFALIGLSQARSSDPIAGRFRAVCASEWHEIACLDDAELVELARERRIDMLIDLGGYGDAGRMAACARRLAPVQIKWVGMQNHSTGLPEIDWFLTDRWETPEGFERHYAERLLYMPDGYVCYTPPAHAPDVASLPALANGHVTFGCFNNVAKITPAVIRTWSAIMRRVPNARLVLKTHQFSEAETAGAVRAAFACEGIPGARVECRGASPHRAFLAQYGDVDFVLDPFPYSGGLTTCEALWMGVPTLTVPGETFASRHSASHMSNVGLGDWVAASLPEYVEQAVARTRDLPALAALRAGMRVRVKASPLCDAPRFGWALGAALRYAWRDWCCSPLNA